LTPFNYLIYETSGHITGILDWNGASYLTVGHSFHPIEQLLGHMTGDWLGGYRGQSSAEVVSLCWITTTFSFKGFEGDLEAIEYILQEEA
jgi:hypothetical protein